MALVPYEVANLARIKLLGNRLLGVTKPLVGVRAPDPHRQAHTDAVAIMTQAVGFDPSGSGPNQATPGEIEAAIPRTEGMLRLANAYARSFRRPRRKA